MNKVAVIAALGVGLGAVAGVYWFRANRLTAADIAEIAEAQQRIASIQKQGADSAAKPSNASGADAAPTEAPIIPPVIEAKANAAAEPAAPAETSDLPPAMTVIPNESVPEKTPDKFTALFNTTKGYFAVEFTREWAPNGADRMYELLKKKFFTDMRLFRMVEGWVVQFGISGDPKVSMQWMDSNIPDDPVKQSNTEGMFTFAAAGAANTRSTQVFINLGDNASRLDNRGFAPVGKVVYGMDVVKSFYGGYAEAPARVQERISSMGNAFLDSQFPKLDSIKEALFIESIVDGAAMEAQQRADGQKPNGKPAQALSETAPESFKAKFDCTMGTFVIECTRAWSPIGADRFYTLVKNGFFNGSKFFRVAPDFVVQFGLPASVSTHSAWVVSRIPDDPKNIGNTEGTIVFAKPPNVANARSSQVFINLKDNSAELDGQLFTPFGKVIEGLDVVKKINPAYGESPEQAKIRNQGNEYLDEFFPNLDGIKTATIVEDAPESATETSEPAGQPAAAEETKPADAP